MKKALLIDDSPFMTQMFAMRLHDDGFQTLIAGNGEDGLKIAASELPDIILLDIAMPGMTGWEVLRLLKKEARTKDIPVIILTNSQSNNEDKDKAKELGAVDFLIKIDLKVDDIIKVVKSTVS